MENYYNEIINALNNIANLGWFEYATLATTIIAIFVNVWLVNNNTNKQIKNQNKETYRPRLKLSNINTTKGNTSDRHLYACSKKYKSSADEAKVYLDLTFKNIGYGVASDVEFYMLHNGKKCCGIQHEEKELNQTLNSTIEIPKDSEQRIKFLFSFNKDSINNHSDSFDENDFILLICSYKDLNGNVYKLLIGFILKTYKPFEIELDENLDFAGVYSDSNFSFYYYQEDTKEYNGMVKKDIYKKFYKKILKKIKK